MKILKFAFTAIEKRSLVKLIPVPLRDFVFEAKPFRDLFPGVDNPCLRHKAECPSNFGLMKF